jgi:diaminohydroxyphosphoribosylaminopyrimidine deaminase/5-amino-6-(5-phosphoribosylamino)uracil reductase
MRRALDLARRAEGSVSPRPPVGAVVAGSDGAILGEGFTQPSPGPHAETVALAAAGAAARGSTLYVSLEPCAHTSVTPPCAQTVVDAGVARVVAAVRDPDPRTSGRGFKLLRSSGISVTIGVCGADARRLIEPFATWVRASRPLVTLKLAASLDGKVAAPDGSSRWITGEEARLEVHELRARVDAVLTGAGTIAADDPALTCRLPGRDPGARQPVRVIVDSSGRTPSSAKVFDDSTAVIVLTTDRAPLSRREEWQRSGARVEVLPSGEGGVSIPDAMRRLGELGLCHVLVECGPALASSLVEAGVADRLIVYLAPSLIGGDAPGLLSAGVKTLADARRLSIDGVSRVGADVRIDARLLGGSGGRQRPKGAAAPRPDPEGNGF